MEHPFTEEQINWLKENLSIKISFYKSKAYFEMSYVEVGLLLENEEFSNYREWIYE